MILRPIALMSNRLPLTLSSVRGRVDVDAQSPQLADWRVYNASNQKSGSDLFNTASNSGSFTNYAAQTWMHGMTYTDGTSPASATGHKTSLNLGTLNGYVDYADGPLSDKIYRLRFYFSVTRYSAKLTVTLKDSGSNTLHTGSIIAKCPDSNGYVGYLQADFYDPAATLLDVRGTWVDDTGNYTDGSGRLYFHSFTIQEM